MPNILIVEDEILIAHLLKSHLENAGFNCCGIAIDYEETIVALETKTIDFIFLDVSLFGDKNGIEIATYINGNYTIPFIFLTSYNDNNTIKEIAKTKPVGYLSKPFKEIDVVTALKLYFSTVKTDSFKSFKLIIGKTTYNIDLTKLLYVKSEHVYSRLIFLNKTLLIRESLSNLIDIFPQEILVRINRSVAINPSFIIKATGTTLEIGDEIFKLSRKYCDNIEYLDSYSN